MNSIFARIPKSNNKDEKLNEKKQKLQSFEEAF